MNLGNFFSRCHKRRSYHVKLCLGKDPAYSIFENDVGHFYCAA